LVLLQKQYIACVVCIYVFGSNRWSIPNGLVKNTRLQKSKKYKITKMWSCSTSQGRGKLVCTGNK